MTPSFVHYIPIVTTLLSAVFAFKLFRHWQRKPDALYLAWWTIGVAMYGVGTLTESLTTLFGWSPLIFKAWYISGALLGGAPLAQGTIYLLLKRTTAHRMTVVLAAWVSVAAVCVILSPLDLGLVETYRLSGRVLEWQWVRLFSPFVNTYAAVFLIGGAIWSAWKYWSSFGWGRRAIGNASIALGAILPGIGGGSARMGHVEVLYVTELVGLIFIWVGYAVIASGATSSMHANQRLGAMSS